MNIFKKIIYCPGASMAKIKLFDICGLTESAHEIRLFTKRHEVSCLFVNI